MNNILTLDTHRMPLSAGDIDSYIRAAHSVPMLSASEELALAYELRDQGSMEAAQRLILAHLRFVISIARDYRNYGLPVADLIQEGNIGLMSAVRRFDPDLGVRLAAYAAHWIRASIYQFILNNWRIVKVATTKAQRKLFFNLHKMKKRLGWFSRQQVEEVAQELDVKPSEVEEMEMRLAGHDQLFDPWSNTDEDAAERSQNQLYLMDLSDEPSRHVETLELEQIEHKALHESLAFLDDRSREIIKRRWFDTPKATLKELADIYGISLERVRQIENAALKKLRGKLSYLEA